jgi:hypothetical protein
MKLTQYIVSTLLATQALAKSNNPCNKVNGKNPARCQDDDDNNGEVPNPSLNSCGAPPTATCLTNADFATGTKIIDTPGQYMLCEDIVFDPNGPAAGEVPGEDAYDPDFSVYDVNAYGLGFFAAIAITASDLELYLNCHTIEQSAGHALFQLFFAVIELASAPFIPNAGPATFALADSFKAASNVKIQGPGTIGRSSHHGIHGNDNSNVNIQHVVFRDFEVAAVSLNNVDNLIIENSVVPQNRHDVPILGSFSAARQLRAYGKALKDAGYTMQLRGVETSASELYDKLINSINKVYYDVVTNAAATGGMIDPVNSPEEYYLFDNPFRVVDGPCYTFVVHGKGPAVGDYGLGLSRDDTLTSSNVNILNNSVNNIKCWTNEIPAAVVDGVVQNDVRGAILQFVSSIDNKPLGINPDGTYRGNVVLDMQVMVAKAIKDGVLVDQPGLQTIVSTVSDSIIDWASSSEGVFSPDMRCNGDSMHHVSKGMVMVRVEDTIGFSIEGNTFINISNVSTEPFGTFFGTCTDYHSGLSIENLEDQQGGNVRVISIAAVSAYSDNKDGMSRITSNNVSDVSSEQGKVVIGIDVQGQSEGCIIDYNSVNLDESAFDGTTDNLISLRVREFVNHSNGVRAIEIGENNDFQQEVQVLNRRRLRIDRNRLSENHPPINEWQLGGCPFARR